MTIYIYSNETGEQVEAIECMDNAECERLANDYHWSYSDAAKSDAV